MIGISEVFQTIGAIIIFSLILLSANRMIQNNTFTEVETEAEQLAVAIGQEIIEEAQLKAFDANTVNGDIPLQIPGGFSSCGAGAGENTRAEFNDFDDYDGYTETLDSIFGPNTFSLEVVVSYVSSPDYDISGGSKTTPTHFKKMRVTVTSDYLQNNREISLTHLRRFYKAKN